MTPPLSAQTVAADTRPETLPKAAVVTVDIDNGSLERVIEVIAEQAGLTPFYSAAVSRHVAPVSVHVHNVTAAEAFETVLSGTGLKASIVSGSVLFAALGNGTTVAVVQGSVSGKVIDAKTKAPLRGATVSLSGISKNSTTGDDGAFRFGRVAPGTYTLSVRMLGYVKAVRTATVIEGQTAAVEIALEQSVSALDQVIVTGTVVATAMRAVPNAMTIITAKQIEERGITRIDQLFHGDIPGLYAMNQGADDALDQVTMFSRGGTSFGGTVVAGTNPIKTYVDGVELANPSYLSQIDPRSIERIEILTGPQASTIYGSNALNGVMQIFTKRGSAGTRPQITAALLSGIVQNNYSPAKTPQQDYSAQVNGTESRMAYNAGGSWTYLGPWSPAKQTATTSGFGGAKVQYGTFSADATYRRGLTSNRAMAAGSQYRTDRQISGVYQRTGPVGNARPITATLDGQTSGLTLEYAPVSWWSHEFVLGADVSTIETRGTASGFSSPSDTLLSYSLTGRNRTSLRYSTTGHIALKDVAQATVTAGVDGWKGVYYYNSSTPASLTGTFTGTTSIYREPTHNTGGFIQGQLGIRDALFFTYGIRAEWNPYYGKEAEPNLAPRYGIAYTQDVGPVTAKLRASYGRSTRPPAINERAAVPETDASTLLYFAPFDSQLANPDLGPEYQQGGEGGFELYWGTHGSLVVTRYNQTVEGLISQPPVDSVRSLVPVPYATSYDGGYDYDHQYQYLNIGAIRNQGWELQGTANIGPFTTKATYSWTKSRMIGVTPKYRYYFNQFPQYQTGSSPFFNAEHTWAVSLGYSVAGTTLSLDLNGTGPVYLGNDLFQADVSSTRLMVNKVRMSAPNSYRASGGRYAMADVNASRRFTSMIEGVLQVHNLADYYQNDYDPTYATIGRQTKAGFRVRW